MSPHLYLCMEELSGTESAKEFQKDFTWQSPKGPFQEALERKGYATPRQETKFHSTLTSTSTCLLGGFRSAFPELHRAIP